MNCDFCGFALLKKSTFLREMLKLHIALQRRERLVSIHCKLLKVWPSHEVSIHSHFWWEKVEFLGLLVLWSVSWNSSNFQERASIHVWKLLGLIYVFYGLENVRLWPNETFVQSYMPWKDLIYKFWKSKFSTFSCWFIHCIYKHFYVRSGTEFQEENVENLDFQNL